MTKKENENNEKGKREHGQVAGKKMRTHKMKKDKEMRIKK